jgi:hypothetical protein
LVESGGISEHVLRIALRASDPEPDGVAGRGYVDERDACFAGLGKEDPWRSGVSSGRWIGIEAVGDAAAALLWWTTSLEGRDKCDGAVQGAPSRIVPARTAGAA